MRSWIKLKSSKGWIVLLATLIGLGFGGYTFVNRAVTAQVYVTNCGILDYKPTCVAGKLHFAAVEIILSKSKRIDGKKALTYISIKTKEAANLPLSNSHNDEWPMELAG